MKIGMDARLINATGIGTYVQNLVKGNGYDVLLGDVKELHAYRNHCEEYGLYNDKILGIRELLRVQFKCKQKHEKIDVLHVPHYNIPLLYRGKLYVTIHDLTPIVLNDVFSKKYHYYARVMIKLAIWKAEKVFVVSEWTKQDIVTYYPKIDPNKIIVTYNGIDPKFEKKEAHEIAYLYEKYAIPKDKKIFIFVGSLLPHKNIKVLIEAFSKMKQKENSRLFLIGRTFKDNETLIALEKALHIDALVMHTGYLNDVDLVNFYNLADVLVFPSLYEGFGFPPLEALQCGTAVLCSNASCLPEIFGEEVTYFDPYDVADLAQKMDGEVKLGNIHNLKQYNWETIIATTRDVMDHDIEKSNRRRNG